MGGVFAEYTFRYTEVLLEVIYPAQLVKVDMVELF